ncbi:hypothetical protein EVAR_53150_1 [Eumeta japonica]|uniref:Uncharacterized protein n=1 Tax=Eumeta variegata TaxID=151549 RepID=A0A4C1YG86_EUMVA|nr:hypothetical protein EVAR_53150_1 [Eumeta japonica]
MEVWKPKAHACTVRPNHLDRVEFSRELRRNNYNWISAESLRPRRNHSRAGRSRKREISKGFVRTAPEAAPGASLTLSDRGPRELTVACRVRESGARKLARPPNEDPISAGLE